MPFARAYARVSAFEEALRRLLPGVEIVSHLEPKDPGTPLEAGASVSLPYSEMAWREIQAAVAKEPLSGQPHKFSTYVLPEQGVCISFHCNVSAGLSVEEAHNVCMDFWTRWRDRLGNIQPTAEDLPEVYEEKASEAAHGLLRVRG